MKVCVIFCPDQEEKLKGRRRSDITLVLTINDASYQCVEVPPMTRQAASGRSKILRYGVSMVAKLKPKGCDRKTPLGVESAGSFYSTRGISAGSDTWWFDRLRTFLIC